MSRNLITLRVTEAERQAIQQAAQERNMSMSNFIRDALAQQGVPLDKLQQGERTDLQEDTMVTITRRTKLMACVTTDPGIQPIEACKGVTPRQIDRWYTELRKTVGGNVSIFVTSYVKGRRVLCTILDYRMLVDGVYDDRSLSYA